MSVPTYTKTGNKATTTQTLNKAIFGLKVESHDLLKQAYHAYLANGRANLAVTKTRGLVRGGGRKPWKQKGTGRARFGSIRNPIWRGGGIVFGPTGQENYTHTLNTQSKRTAIKQALSLQNSQIKVIETFESKDGKTNETAKLLAKLGAERRILLVVDNKNDLVERATRNISNLLVVQAKYLNVFDILNADSILIRKESLKIIDEWLGGDK